MHRAPPRHRATAHRAPPRRRAPCTARHRTTAHRLPTHRTTTHRAPRATAPPRHRARPGASAASDLGRSPTGFGGKTSKIPLPGRDPIARIRHPPRKPSHRSRTAHPQPTILDDFLPDSVARRPRFRHPCAPPSAAAATHPLRAPPNRGRNHRAGATAAATPAHCQAPPTAGDLGRLATKSGGKTSKIPLPGRDPIARIRRPRRAPPAAAGPPTRSRRSWTFSYQIRWENVQDPADLVARAPTSGDLGRSTTKSGGKTSKICVGGRRRARRDGRDGAAAGKARRVGGGQGATGGTGGRGWMRLGGFSPYRKGVKGDGSPGLDSTRGRGSRR
ncbi:hypothetical protein BJ964_000563 [Actinoplanes lobatus]|uniref:Uncharacterized protein n=1 Tax=Actinoplanes lobatus TaxID=113568 RepID=A0A7W7MDN2_9ACTN|nr:hypothetical protein [Actinoplanes lobatus]